MTDAEPALTVLALNSGSSSLKFGLYRAKSSRTEMLLSGEADSIGSKTAKFHAQIWRENAVLSETISISSQRDAIIRIGSVLADSKMRHRLPSGTATLIFRTSCGQEESAITALRQLGFCPLDIWPVKAVAA
jgi:acetate kinase